MNIQVETVAPNLTIVRLAGRINSQTVSEIDIILEPLLVPQCRLLLDMSAVTYMSSAGLRTLLVIYRNVEENGGQVVLAGVKEPIRDTMSMTGFLEHFVLSDTVEAGLTILQE